MAYAVKVADKVLVDTVYEHEELSKLHWLSYSSGDYDPDEFLMLPGKLTPSVEFAKYPEATTVRVLVHAVELVH
ncbi:hypothetical protein [Sulfitobacter pacificus]|uniref:Uncharacterized protein n=1 Tax=Sulfitobacter pacificus TaxID=1499314 RepID=A0ABQ5VGE9_9RHOB|nr:hypothetical protein [Sulfitobacter pacificus]GLQ26158.1 hypothetical protein GCM10007927_09610 [Sulfitobacter pacificus]